jgi:hypothetical protein
MPINNIVYYSEGMKHFGERMVEDMNFKRYNPETDKDKEVFFQGLYFEQDYRAFIEHKGRKILYWNGSDILRMLQIPKWKQIIQSTPARHLCHSYWQQEVLRRIGLEVEIYPIFFGNLEDFEVCFKPSKKPQVYMTSHDGRGEEYGVDRIERVAPKVPDVTFHIYGEENSTDNDNVIYHGWVDEEIMNEEIKEYQGAVKGGSNGISVTLIKSSMMGQYPISYEKIEGLWHAPDDKNFIKQLNRLKDMKEPNLKLRKKYLNHFKPI